LLSKEKNDDTEEEKNDAKERCCIAAPQSVFGLAEYVEMSGKCFLLSYAFVPQGCVALVQLLIRVVHRIKPDSKD
jgi:hypothetical protein